MRYDLVPPQRRFHGPVHWSHTLLFRCKQSRVPELFAFLDEMVGKDKWRWQWAGNVSSLSADYPYFIRIKFLEVEHAFKVKLMWLPCELTESFKIIIPVLRNVMPSLIAHDIIGVSPMTGPISSIYTMRSRTP